MLEAVEDFGAQVCEVLLVVGFPADVDAVDRYLPELVQPVDDTAAESDFVDVDLLDVVTTCEFECSSGGLHKIGLAERGHVKHCGTLADDGDGLAVAESSDVEPHHRIVFVDVVECAFGRIFDQSDRDQRVDGFGREIAEDSILVREGIFAALACVSLDPIGCRHAGRKRLVGRYLSRERGSVES